MRVGEGVGEGERTVVIGVSPQGRVGEREGVGEGWNVEKLVAGFEERGPVGVLVGRGELVVFMYVEMLIVEGYGDGGFAGWDAGRTEELDLEFV